MQINTLDKYFGRLGNRMFQMAYIFAQFKEWNIPDIYLQDCKYFEKYADEIKQMFGEGIGYDDRIAIHVRRAANPANSDEPKYSENPFYVNLSETDYYQKAMALFPGNQFIVFSDDPDWCKRQEIFEDCEISFSTELAEFNLMASCKGIIMANSSFSWWAAFLGADKKVVYPKTWFADGIQRVGFPKEWICI